MVMIMMGIMVTVMMINFTLRFLVEKQLAFGDEDEDHDHENDPDDPDDPDIYSDDPDHDCEIN